MALIPGQDTVVQLLPAFSLCLFVSAVYNKPSGGVLGISSDGDDRKIFFGFEIFDSRIFLGTKIWQVFVLGWLDFS